MANCIRFIILFSFSIRFAFASPEVISPFCKTGQNMHFPWLNLNKCEEVHENDFKAQCDCLNKAQENNILIQTSFKSSREDAREWNKQQKDSYRKKFLNIYKDKLFSSSYQKEILFSKNGDWDSEGRVQTCSPSQFSKLFTENAESFYTKQAEKMLEKIVELKEEMAAISCNPSFVILAPPPCSDMKVRLKELSDVVSRPIREKVVGLCGETSKKLDDVVVALIEKVPASDKIEEMIEWYRFHGKTEKVIKFTDLKNRPPVCTADGSSDPVMDEAYLEFATDKVKEKGVQKVAEDSEDCKSGDKLCESLKSYYSAVEKKLKKNHTPEDEKKQCFTFAEFLTINSIPNEFMLAGISSGSVDQISKMLDATTIKDSNDERLPFFQSNPLISKHLGSRKNREKIAMGLKEYMGGDFKNNQADKLNAYLKFMKAVVQPMVIGSSLADKDVCDELAQLYTGIEVADSFPVAPQNGDVFEKITLCKVEEQNENSVVDIGETLRNNSHLLINGDKSILDSDVDSMAEYNKFIDNSCKNFETHVATRCNGQVNDSCRKTFDPRKKLSEALDKNGIATTLTDKNHRSATRVGKKYYDDVKFEDWYDATVRKKKKSSPVAFKGEGAKFRDDKAHNEELVANANIPAELRTPSTGSVVGRAPASIGKAVEDESKMTSKVDAPPWTQPAEVVEPPKPINPQNLERSTNVSSYIQNDEDLTEKEVEQNRDEVEQEMHNTLESMRTPENSKDIDKKKAQVSRDMNHQRKQDQKNLSGPNTPQFSKAATLGPSGQLPYGSVAGSNNFGYAGNFANIPGSNLAARPFGPVKKGNGLNQVLLSTKYKEIGQNPQPENGLVLQSVLADQKEMSKVKDNGRELNLSESEFDAIWGSQEKLAEYLFSEIKDPKESVITLKTKTKDNQVKELKVHIFKNGKGYSARVRPKASLSNLNQTIKSVQDE